MFSQMTNLLDENLASICQEENAPLTKTLIVILYFPVCFRRWDRSPPRRPRAPLWWVWPRQGAIPWGSQLFGSEGQRLSPTCFPPPVASPPVSECLTFLPQSDTRHTTSGRTPSTGITVVISVSDPSAKLVSTRVISVREWGDAIASAAIVFYCCASAGDDVVIRAKGW